MPFEHATDTESPETPESIELLAGETSEDQTPDLEEKAVAKTRNIFEEFGIDVIDEDGLEVADYREMMRREAQIKAAVMLKIYARISSGYDIQPASDDPEDVKVAEFIEAQFDDMQGAMTKFLRGAMLAMAYGLTVHEIVLKQIETGDWAGKIGLKALKWKRPENFRVKTDKFGNVESVQQKSEDNSNDWVDLPPEYFVVWAWDHEGDYKGKSDLRPAYRWFKAKDLIDKIWNIFLDKYATPTPMAEHSGGADKSSQDEMLRAISKLHATKALVVPKSWNVSLLEAMRQGGASYEEKIKYCDRMMARAILLPTLLLDEGDKGAYALGQQHADNFTWVLGALGDELAEEIIEEQIIRPLVGWNFTVSQIPKFVWRPFQGVDLKDMADAFEKLINNGVVDAAEEFIREKMNLPPRENIPAAEGGATPTGGDPSGRNGPDGGELELKRGGVVDLRSAAGKKFHASEVKKRQNEIADTAIDEISETTRGMLVDLKKKVKKQKILENRDYAAVSKLTLTGVSSVRKSLEFALGQSVMWGASDGKDELERGAKRSGEPFPIEWPATMGVNLSSGKAEEVVFNEPAEFVTTRAQIIAQWEGKVPIQRQLLAEYTRESFTITGVYRDDLLNGSKRIIEKGIRRGASYTQVAGELDNYWQPYLDDPGAIDPGVANAHRIDTMVRTNMSEAYNSGRMNLFRDPAVGDFIVAFEYSSVMDDRTTPFCVDWDGTIMTVNDPRIDTVNPPNHFRCRAVLIPITRGEIYELTDVMPIEEPAKGFNFGAAA